MGERRKVPLPTRSYELHVILVRPAHPGNLGAVCRAMLNFGFTSLRLIEPLCSPDDEEARNLDAVTSVQDEISDEASYS